MKRREELPMEEVAEFVEKVAEKMNATITVPPSFVPILERTELTLTQACELVNRFAMSYAGFEFAREPAEEPAWFPQSEPKGSLPN